MDAILLNFEYKNNDNNNSPSRVARHAHIKTRVLLVKY